MMGSELSMGSLKIMASHKPHKPFSWDIAQAVPNTLTAAALLFGLLALFTLTTRQDHFFIWFFFLAVFFDLMDGRVARWMQRQSDLGAQLDSLCDMVTFGTLPVVAYHHFVFHQLSFFWFPVLVFYSWSTALRLARFNLTEPSDIFSGLPCPVAAVFVLTFLWAQSHSLSIPLHPILCALLLLLAGWLQISSIPYTAFKKIGKKEVIYLVAMLFLFVALCMVWNIPIAIWLVSLLYILWGALLFAYGKMSKKKTHKKT
jgi:CDP-diacylglycerol---serine O-phosphatidyltransferase